MPKGIPKNGINKGWFKKNIKPHNKDKKKSKICLFCGKKFVDEKGNSISKRKYCSIQCAGKVNGYKKGNIPVTKGKSNKWGHHTEKTKEKIRKNLAGRKRPEISGEKNCNWKGGITKRNLNSIEYKQWREKVLKKDNYICRLCGMRVDLQVHHKKRWSDFPILRFDINNGVTLCRHCHKLVTFKILWIYGNSQSGKTTLAKKILNIHYAVHLDGDMMRNSINRDLGLSKKDRIENNLRIARLADVLRKQNIHVIISTICPFRELREEIKKILPLVKFLYIEGGKEGKEYPFDKPSLY